MRLRGTTTIQRCQGLCRSALDQEVGKDDAALAIALGEPLQLQGDHHMHTKIHKCHTQDETGLSVAHSHLPVGVGTRGVQSFPGCMRAHGLWPNTVRAGLNTNLHHSQYKKSQHTCLNQHMISSVLATVTFLRVYLKSDLDSVI